MKVFNLMRWNGFIVRQPCELGFLINHLVFWFIWEIGFNFWKRVFLHFEMSLAYVVLIVVLTIICASNVSMCLLLTKYLINCLYELWDWISWLVLWWLLYEVMSCNLSCLYMITYVAFRFNHVSKLLAWCLSYSFFFRWL